MLIFGVDITFKELPVSKITVGLIILVVSAIFPLPMMFGISGIVWRIIIAILGIFLLIKGINKISRKNNLINTSKRKNEAR